MNKETLERYRSQVRTSTDVTPRWSTSDTRIQGFPRNNRTSGDRVKNNSRGGSHTHIEVRTELYYKKFFGTSVISLKKKKTRCKFDIKGKTWYRRESVLGIVNTSTSPGVSLDGKRPDSFPRLIVFVERGVVSFRLDPLCLLGSGLTRVKGENVLTIKCIYTYIHTIL